MAFMVTPGSNYSLNLQTIMCASVIKARVQNKVVVVQLCCRAPMPKSIAQQEEHHTQVRPKTPL